MFWKNTKRCHEIMPTGFLQNFWVFCKATEMCPAKTHVVCKNTEKCFAKILKDSAKILKAGCQIAGGSSIFSGKMSDLIVKTQRLGLFPVRSRPVNKTLLRAKSFANFWYWLKHEKSDTGDDMSYDL